jgi:hypothetical protein
VISLGDPLVGATGAAVFDESTGKVNDFAPKSLA